MESEGQAWARGRGEGWSEHEVAELREMASLNTHAGLIAYKLGRTEHAVRSRAADEGISLAPPSYSPFGMVRQTENPRARRLSSGGLRRKV
jgi:hypothetical protein